LLQLPTDERRIASRPSVASAGYRKAVSHRSAGAGRDAEPRRGSRRSGELRPERREEGRVRAGDEPATAATRGGRQVLPDAAVASGREPAHGLRQLLESKRLPDERLLLETRM